MLKASLRHHATYIVVSTSTLAAVVASCSSGGEAAAPVCVVTAVNVSPPSSDVFIGASLQLSATVTNTNCSPAPQASWQSSATGIATVSALGVVTGVAEGTSTITASAGGQSGSSTITVRRETVATVAVTTPAPTVSVGATAQAVAEVRSAAGTVLTGRTVTWQSSNQARATVTAGGLITGVSAGAVTITANAEGQAGSVAITVTGTPTLQVTSITPSAAATDVSIESTIRIQFSAAVTASTVTPTSVLVSRVGGAGVAGTFAVSGTTVTFTPASLLTEFAASYSVTVTAGVLSTVGNYLASPFSSSFTTSFWDPNYYYRITNESQTAKSLDTFGNTFGCFMGDNGTFTGQYWYFVPVAGQAGFYYLKNLFQGDTKALEGSDSPNRCFLTNLAPTGQFFTGQAWRPVAYGTPYAGGFRLQNQNLGSAKSLGVTLVNNEPYPSMLTSASAASQVWYFARLTRR